MRRFSWLWMGCVLAAATACQSGLPDNSNLSGDACAQLTQAFAHLNASLTGCGFNATFLSNAECESLLSSCNTIDLADGGGDVGQLLQAADCVNQIPGGDCGTYPNLAANATVAFAGTCFSNDTPNLSPACQLVDAGTTVIADGPLVGGQPALFGSSIPSALISWGSDMVTDPTGSFNVCPTPASTVLTGTSTTTCTVDADCAPTCCLCDPDGGAGGPSYLSAACLSGTCVPTSWVCNVINAQVTNIFGVGICSNEL